MSFSNIPLSTKNMPNFILDLHLLMHKNHYHLNLLIDISDTQKLIFLISTEVLFILKEPAIHLSQLTLHNGDIINL
jgi:hypothetical protein